MAEFAGKVKSYNPSKGWGFVECPETKEKYNKDILFQASELCGRDAKPGEELTFQVKDGRNGPIAVSLRFATEGSSSPAGSFSGSVKSYNPVKGWGFIECAETQHMYGKDMLFQSSQLRGREVQKGESVTFNVADGKTGPIAVSLVFSGPARPAARSTAVMPFKGSGGRIGEYVGTVKSYSSMNGYGFVTSDETQMMYGKDILFRTDELRGHTPSKGEPVAFCIGDGKGGPVAVSLRFPGAWPPAQAFPQPTWPSAAPFAGARFYGAIKSFNSANGWGFIESDATQQIYGKDMFVRLGDLKGLEAVPGTEVVFSIADGAKGPVATDVTPAPGAGGAGGGFGAVRGAKGGARPSPYGPPPSGKPAAPPGPGKLAKPSGAQIMCGTVKHFEESKGYGFITGQGIKEMFGKDVFMAKQSLQGSLVSPGDQVRFTYELGLKGPMAVKVEVLPNSSFAEGGVAGAVYSGEVKSFNPETGWGFVTSPETMTLFGKDLFLHKRVLPEGVEEVMPGDPVSFSVKLNGARPEVASVSMISGATS